MSRLDDEQIGELADQFDVNRRDIVKLIAVLGGGSLLATSGRRSSAGVARAAAEDAQIELGDAASDPVDNGDISRNGADVKVFSGGAVRNLSDIGGANTPAWQEDANSPINGSGAQSHTITLNGSYDRVWLIIQEIANTHGSTQEVALQMNGDTGTSYSYTTADGTRNDGVSQIVIQTLSDTFSTSGELKITGSNANVPVVEGPMGGAAPSNHLLYGENVSGSALPLDSITLLGVSGNITAKARVFGWSGGL